MRLPQGKFWKPPYRISIRAQLTALVSIVAIVSLVILAVTTGVYFTSNYKDLRSDRLYIAAQLKSSQIDQTLNYLYYQCYYLSSRDTLQAALINYAAGNKTAKNWIDSQTVVEKFLSSSDLFSIARVYDSNFEVIVNITNNGSGNYVPSDVLTNLLPLSTDDALPSSLETYGILTDPVVNGSVYLMSMSLPIYAKPSIILSNSRVYGYVTIIMSAEGLKSVFNDTTALENSNVAVVSAQYINSSSLENYSFIFNPYGEDIDITSFYFPIPNNTFLNTGLVQGKGGSVKRTKFIYNNEVAIGYSPCSFDLVNWLAVVTQPETVFLSPSTKLEKIITGTVVAIAVFVCLVTFPLSHWAVKPIVRLQKATELISEGRGLRPNAQPSNSNDSRSYSLKWRGSIENHVRASLGIFNNEKPNLSDDHLADNMLDGSSYNVSQQDISNRTSVYENDSFSLQKFITSSNLNEARVPVYSRLLQDELSELTDTFNTMTDALDQHYALLEDRVRARTKQLEAAKIEAEAANEAKTVFIANISHELRTPLNGILGMTAISMEEEDENEIKDNLKLIFRSGELLLHILTELLTFSKNVLKRTNLEKRDFCITDVALQIKSIFGKVARDQHVRLSIFLMPNMIRGMVLWGDSNRIIQIVMNLVSNALKFTPVDGKVDVRIKLLGEYDEERSVLNNHKEVYIKSGTEIPIITRKLKTIVNSKDNKEKIETLSSTSANENSVSNVVQHIPNHNDEVGDNVDAISIITTNTRLYDDTALFSQLKKTTALSDDDEKIGEEVKNPKIWVISVEVDDTGPGIEKKLQESVFEPFVQGDQSLSRQYGGTGLGLSICRQLASMMHGTMKLESAVGVGSRFVFTVPLNQTREIDFTSIADPFEDEFNAESKKNRKFKFNIFGSSKSIPTRSSISSTLGSESEEKNNELPISRDAPSKTTVVRFDRPFLQSTGTATSSKNVPTISSNIKAQENKNIKILVAEDNHVNQEVIKRMLNLEKISNIDLACDGQDAFDKTKGLIDNGKYYDIIFMDVQMPKVDGLVSTKMIRNELKYTHPIVALSAFADDDNIQECLDAGMNGFLGKPIKRPKLKEILKEYINR